MLQACVSEQQRCMKAASSLSSQQMRFTQEEYDEFGPVVHETVFGMQSDVAASFRLMVAAVAIITATAVAGNSNFFDVAASWSSQPSL